MLHDAAAFSDLTSTSFAYPFRAMIQCGTCCCTLWNEEAPSNLPDLPREPLEKDECEEPALPTQLQSEEVLEPHPEPEELSCEAAAPFVRGSSQEEADALGSLLRDLKQLPRSHTLFRRSTLFDIQATSSLKHSHGPSLQCLHDVLQILWPKVNIAVERFMMEEVQSKIQETLPGPLRSFRFQRFKLGRGVPQVLGVEVSDAPCRSVERQGVELRVAFNLESEVSIAISLLGFSAGLSYLSMKGSAVIRLEPLLNELPVVGGIVVYFVDAPKIDFRVNCGPVQVSNWPFLKQKLQDLLSSVMTTALLLPNVINIPLVDDEDVVDTATLRDAKPLGILRVVVANVTSTGARKARLFSAWPQVRLQLCAEEWICPATSVSSCCWEAKQPRGRISIQMEGLSGLDMLGTYVRVQLGQQSYRTETASEDSSWTRCHPISFSVGSEQTLRLEVHRAGNRWQGSLGFVDIKVGSFGSLQPGMWNKKDEQLRGAEQVKLQFEMWYEPGAGTRRNFHDFFVYDWNQKLMVSLRDLNKLGLPTTVGVAKPRKVSQLVAGGPDMWKMHLHDEGVDSQVLSETRGEVELSLDWLEVLPDPVGCVNYLVECRFDEVYASNSFRAEMLAMRASIGTVVKQTPLAKGKDNEFKIETILRLPVTRSTLETESLELAAVDGRGNVCASLLLRLRQLISGNLMESKLQLDGPSKLHAQVSLKCSGLGSRAHAERQRWKSKESANAQTSSSSFHLDWVNQVCSKLHPKVTTIAARQLEDPFGLFTQSLRVKMPLPLKDIHFSHFMLGTTPPEVGPFEVREWQHPHDGSMGIEMKVGFHLDTEANIEMQVHGIKLGINRMFLKGDLLIRLEPLIDELPVIGGIVACFLNQPELEFHYSGLAARVDSNILRQLLQSAVAKAMVLPHAVTIPIGTEEQNVDRALLDPAPVGVLRIWALSASDLPSSWPLGSRSRSPYMYVSLETEEWQTSVVYHSTSPQWNQKHDFLVFDKRQEVQVKIFDIFDSNSLFTRNVIAAALPIAVDDLVYESDQELALLNCEGGEDGASPSQPSSPAGTAMLRFEWLKFVRPGRRGPDSRHLLRIKFDEVVIPCTLLDVHKATVLDPTMVRMRAKVNEVTKNTPAVAWFPTTSCAEVSATDPNVPTVELDLEHTLFLLINSVDLDAGALELELCNGHDRVLGFAQIKIPDVLAAGGMKWRGDRRLVLKNAAGQCLADVEVSIQGLRLAQECVMGF